MGAEQPNASDSLSLFCSDGRIADIGAPRRADIEVDAEGCTVVPGFVDAHTHLPYVASAPGSEHGPEWVFACASALAASDDAAVIAFAEHLAAGMLAGGTTCFEMKSGLGLSVAGELRHLRLAQALAARVPQCVATTCLAAHAVPPGKSQGQWVGEAATSLLPQVARKALASACDVHVELFSFALEHAARLTRAAHELGLRMRIHADRFADNQTAAFAARWGLATADHLNHTSLDAIDDLASSDTMAVLLPASTLAVGQSRHPSARALLEAGAAVALGSDAGPVAGAPGMLHVMELACETLGLSPVEALGAATVNAACALGLDGCVGRLELDGRADAVVLGAPDLAGPHIPPVVAVVCAGRLAYVAPGAEDRILGR
ncbi:MAG: amidohydrolase family protein [Actinomycetota bacterium]|nr:amidohydrolase family protein [Actinomycetota bacterium]